MLKARHLAAAAILLLPPGVLAAHAAHAAHAAQWQPPPPPLRADLAKFRAPLAKAMADRDQARVLAITAEMRKALGSWAGKTEVETHYYTPIDAGKPPSPVDLRRGWDALFRFTEAKYKGGGRWGSTEPEPLRHTADIVIGMIDAVRAGAGDRRLEEQRIREGLAYLLSVQAANGVFPFPDVRGRDNFFGPMIQRLIARVPNAVSHGWLIEDDDDGGLQFDNGVCGYAMLEGWNLLHDRKYLDSARRAADWASAHVAVPNFNYNVFSVWLLARFYRATHERKYLDSAIGKIRIGVLPGQLSNGRWMDFHNARPAYHWILIRGMLQLYEALPDASPFKPELKRSLFAAIRNGTDEIRTHGAPSLETPLAVLSLVCADLKPEPQWRTALNVLINAAFDREHDNPAEIHDLSPYPYGAYLLYRTQRSAR
jgi:hypothetical protein